MPVYNENHKLLGWTIQTWSYKPERVGSVYYAKQVPHLYYTVLAEDYFKV